MSVVSLRSGGFEVVDGWVTLHIVEGGKARTLRVPQRDLPMWLRHLESKGVPLSR